MMKDRPVMTQKQLIELSHRILHMTTVDVVDVRVIHTAQLITRFANGRVLTSDDGETLQLIIRTANGAVVPSCELRTNQLDEALLLAGVQQCEALLRASPNYQPDVWEKHEGPAQDTPVAVQLWHEPTVQAMNTVRQTVLPDVLNAVANAGLQAAGFLGLMARAQAVVRKDGNIVFFSDETDSELTVTARTADGQRSGWGGQAARDWSTIMPRAVVERAIRMATLAGAPVAIEPGRRTAIFTAAAVTQMVRFLAQEFDARLTDIGRTALSKYPSPRGGNKLRQRIVDPRVTLRSDPADPEGGYCPFFESAGYAVATPAMTWVEQGILHNMAYDVTYAMEHGKAYADHPTSLRMSGGPTTLEQMIASCPEGIYVNRVSDVDLLDSETCLLTGVTRDGCFLIKDGKIRQAVKNFRFVESPFFFLNKLDALGVPERAAFGYTPTAAHEYFTSGDWPRPPMIVPPMMVRDFNFVSLSDAV